jgi:fumarate reductase subunit D
MKILPDQIHSLGGLYSIYYFKIHSSLLPIAQVPASLKTSIQFALGVVFLFGFIWGVIKIWGGADRMSKGDADGKMGIVSGIIIAGAAAIMGALFTIFGMSDGVLTPQF